MKHFSPWLFCLAAAGSLFAQSNSGTIAGTIFDAANGQPIRQATVSLKDQPISISTDTDGKFTLTVPKGTYTVLVRADNFLDAEISDVVVQPGEVVEASTVMAGKGTVTTVEVSEKIGAVAATAEAALTERKLSAVVSDSISNEEIKNSVASDAAGAVEKVTGVSIVDNGYVFVRGLGERYSATMLNNAMIPTTEPERRVVPLDLFPSALIDNIKVLKTYSADLPGEFSGGLVQLTTIEFPTQKVFSFTANFGMNSQTSFRNFKSYLGGGTDAFGVDDGTRALPSVIPTDQRLFVGSFNEQQFQEFGRSFPVNYDVAPVTSMRPTQTYSVVGGNTFGRLGLVGALTFTNNPQRIPEIRRFLVNSGAGKPQIFSDYTDFNSETEAARIGGVLNAALKLTTNNKLIFRNTLTRDTDKEARVFRGLNGSNGQEIEDVRLRWVERALFSTGAEGEHILSKLGSTLARWQFTYSRSTRGEPDMRETIRGREPGSTGAYTYLNLPESGFRFFSDLADKIYEPQADLTKPFYKGSISGLFKGGFRGTIRRRDFSSRRFRFFPVRAQTIDFNAPTNTVLGTNNIRPDGMVLREITRGTDTYDASMDIYGGFGMVDLALGRHWRVIAGARYEDADINVTTVDVLVPNSQPVTARLSNRDVLPSVNVIYQVTPRQNLRFGWGRTVNRPDFRELSPFEFTNIVGGYSTVGNPQLQRAKIDNFDARWEWFMGGNQILAASYFYKDFTSPIEQIYRPTASELRQSFLNVSGAINQGVELEFRKNLGSLSPKLAPFAIQTNVTFVNSNVQIPVDEFPQLTSRERPLVGQSRFIYNVIGEWVKPAWRSNARFYVNSVSRRITDVGTFQLPDIYQERTTFLDFVYQFNLSEKGRWNLRFSAENLGDNRYRYTQADFLVRDFRIGRTYTIGTTYSFF